VASGDLSCEKESIGVVELKCEYCGGAGHVLIDCFRFQRISIQERYNFMKSKGLCYGCLKKGHVTKKCRNRLKCTSCGRQHPTILHDPSRLLLKSSINRDENNNSASSNPNVDQSVIHTACSDISASCHTGAGEQTSAMAIIHVRIKLKNKNHSVITYAFFDSGSSVTFCSENLMQQLGINGKNATSL
jgi:ribosomal protein L44E